MSVNGTVLALLIRTKMDTKFKNVRPYAGPMAQNNPSYFIQMCDAIGKGIVQGSPAINFVTQDTGFSGAPPIVGTGIGLGIIVDKNWFTKNLYIEIRNKAIETYGSTGHPVWCDEYATINEPQNPLPQNHCSINPNQYNPYNFLTAMCEAISEGVTEHYAQFRVLQGTHPTVYSGAGEILNGGFIGVVPATVASSIQGLGTTLSGSFWPIVCQAIGLTYSNVIMQQSTGSLVITGVCVPSQSQVCGVPVVGVGSGTAS